MESAAHRGIGVGLAPSSCEEKVNLRFRSDPFHQLAVALSGIGPAEVTDHGDAFGYAEAPSGQPSGFRPWVGERGRTGVREYRLVGGHRVVAHELLSEPLAAEDDLGARWQSTQIVVLRPHHSLLLDAVDAPSRRVGGCQTSCVGTGPAEEVDLPDVGERGDLRLVDVDEVVGARAHGASDGRSSHDPLEEVETGWDVQRSNCHLPGQLRVDLRGHEGHAHPGLEGDLGRPLRQVTDRGRVVDVVVHHAEVGHGGALPGDDSEAPRMDRSGEIIVMSQRVPQLERHAVGERRPGRRHWLRSRRRRRW